MDVKQRKILGALDQDRSPIPLTFPLPSFLSPSLPLLKNVCFVFNLVLSHSFLQEFIIKHSQWIDLFSWPDDLWKYICIPWSLFCFVFTFFSRFLIGFYQNSFADKKRDSQLIYQYQHRSNFGKFQKFHGSDWFRRQLFYLFLQRHIENSGLWSKMKTIFESYVLDEKIR